MNKGFTLVELVIVLAIVSIMAAVLIPTFANVYNKGKEDIIDTVNSKEAIKIDNATGETITNTDGYHLSEIEYRNGEVILYYEKD